MLKITQIELHRKIAAHERWLKNINEGDPLNLVGVNLQNLEFCEADLRMARLCGVNAKGANFQKVNLQGADLLGSFFPEANFWGADLRGVDSSYGDFRFVNMRGADLRDAVLKNSNLNEAVLSNADLRDVNFRKASLEGTLIQGADLRGANFREAKINFSPDFRKTDFRNTGIMVSLVDSFLVIATPESFIVNNDMRTHDEWVSLMPESWSYREVFLSMMEVCSKKGWSILTDK